MAAPYEQGPPPQYGYPPPPQQQQQQQQQTTVVIAGGQQAGPTIVQIQRERFADKICLNLFISFFCPFWPLIWLIMCFFEK